MNECLMNSHMKQIFWENWSGEFWGEQERKVIRKQGEEKQMRKAKKGRGDKDKKIQLKMIVTNTMRLTVFLMNT